MVSYKYACTFYHEDRGKMMRQRRKQQLCVVVFMSDYEGNKININVIIMYELIENSQTESWLTRPEFT